MITRQVKSSNFPRDPPGDKKYKRQIAWTVWRQSPFFDFACVANGAELSEIKDSFTPNTLPCAAVPCGAARRVVSRLVIVHSH